MSKEQHTIVGSGGSGCVVCPPFNYNALDSQNCVGKVIQREVSKEVVEEWNNAVALHNIPNANEYFVYPFQWNYVDRQKFEKMFKISAHTDNEQLLQYIMPNSGRELRKCIKENNIAPSKIVEYMLQIARGVELLQTNKLVHNDLHLSNVMLQNDKPLICDLSVMTTFKGFYEDRLTQGFIFDPFEVKILSETGFDDDIPINFEKKSIENSIPIDRGVFDYIFESDVYIDSHKAFYRDLRRLYKTYHNEEDNNLRSAIEILKQWDSHSKADVYGLGISLAEMLLYVDTSEEDVKVVDALKALATDMLLCHPKQRPSITVVIERLETLKS